MLISIVLCAVSIALCLLAFVHFNYHRRQRKLLQVLRRINNGSAEKIFASGENDLTEICFEINLILEHLQAENRLTQQNATAQKELLASLSHDIRTPLTSLAGYLEALNNGNLAEDEQKRYLQTAQKKAAALKTLIDELFDWSMLNSSEQTFEFQTTDTCELTREIIIDWLPVFDANGINASFDIPDDECRAVLDRPAWRRIINNLLQNALMHSQCRNLSLKLQTCYGNLQLLVTDDGAGIPPDKLPQIFERLYKCDRSRSRSSSGLGLAIVKKLTEQHHGTASASSTPGQTVFLIEIPCRH